MLDFIGFNDKVRPNKEKKARYAIVNIIKKDFSKIIRDFENYVMKDMIIRDPNMNLLTATFTYQDSLRSL